jgi:malate dehydrogenase
MLNEYSQLLIVTGQNNLLQTVQQRGAAVIKARKLSSAMSAAKAIVDHVRDWWNGVPEVSTR